MPITGFAEIILLDIGMLSIPFLYLKFFERKKIRPEEFGFRKAAPSDIVLSAKILLCLIIYSALLSLAFYFLNLNDFAGVEKAAGIIAAAPVTLAYYMTVRVFAEEFFFRAFLVPRTGVIASSIVFGLSHSAYGSTGEVIGAIVLGAILGIAYRENRLLAANFAGHALYNLAAIILFMGA